MTDREPLLGADAASQAPRKGKGKAAVSAAAAPINGSPSGAFAPYAVEVSDAYRILPLTSEYKVESFDDIHFKEDSDFWKAVKGAYLVCVPIVSWIHAAVGARLIPEGSIGLSLNNGVPEFLRPGWHFLADPRRSLVEVSRITGDSPLLVGTRGLVTVRDGFVGVAQDSGRFLLLGPGIHCWNSPTFQFMGLCSILDNVVRLGPYTLVTVPAGSVAVVELNGTLSILGENAETGQRSHFLNHPKAIFRGLISTQVQFDQLQGSDLLTSDRVEVDLDSTVAWKIADPHKAALHGGSTMAAIRQLVDREARSTVAQMVASRKISDRSVGGSTRAPASSSSSSSTALAAPAPPDADDIHASRQQLAECNEALAEIGVHVTQIAIVQLKVKDNDTRMSLAAIASIPAKTKEMRDVAKAAAENRVIEARAEGEARLAIARAEADAILVVAQAQQKAGELLGAAGSTASRLALVAATGTALKEANAQVYFVPTGTGAEYLLSNPNVVGTARVEGA